MVAVVRNGWTREGARQVLLALGAGVLYGSWAAFANQAGGAAVALRAALTQMLLSMAATLMLELVLERLFRLGRTPRRGFWLSWLGSSMLAATALVTGHVLVGTPHVATTIAPSLMVGTALCYLYARGMLARRGRGHPSLAA